jgi:hypothetical protein
MTVAAIALDKMMRRLTEADRAAMRKAAPAHLVDQFDAATDDVDQVIAGIGHDRGASLGECTYADVPDWLRLALADTWQGFLAGSIDTCMHQPVVTRPQPIVAAVWHRNLIVCAACAYLTRAVGAADKKCDCCGRVCAGLPGDGIHACSLGFGPLLFFYGLCVGCMADHNEATS